ncbi:D-aminoacyl-tRNA deacylase [Luteococcus sediminum]
MGHHWSLTSTTDAFFPLRTPRLRTPSLGGMRVVVQKALEAQVSVAGEVVGSLPSPGLVLLVGITHEDDQEVMRRMAEKLWGLRILDGERSASDEQAPLLVVSQFTLYANCRKGRRPSWSAAAPGPVSEPLVEHFVACLRELGAHVETGRFGADMQVGLVNDGPVTILLDSEELFGAR